MESTQGRQGPSSSQRRAVQVFFLIVALLVVPATITLYAVQDPGRFVLSSENPTPFGYAWSLLLFVAPLSCIAWWFSRRPDLVFPRKSFCLTIAILVPSGLVLDVLFGSAFFTFNNRGAVLGVFVPVVGGRVPIEEFAFYISGFSLILLMYIWCDEYWLNKYNIPSYPEASKGIHRIVRFHPASLAVGVVLIVGGFAYKKLFSSSPEGFSSYFTYLILVAIVPSVGFFKTANLFINWRAFGFTFFPILLISLLWEVTLAIPYQWWGYQKTALLGIDIGAWSNLPLEAVCVWLSATFATVITYETIKVWQAMKKPAREAFFGVARK